MLAKVLQTSCAIRPTARCFTQKSVLAKHIVAVPCLHARNWLLKMPFCHSLTGVKWHSALLGVVGLIIFKDSLVNSHELHFPSCQMSAA